MLLSWEKEPFEQHVKQSLDAWSQLRSKYQKSLLKRLGKYLEEGGERFGLNEIDLVVRGLINLHDIGKCVPLYQKYVRKPVNERSLHGYRHELVGGYVGGEWLRSYFKNERLGSLGAVSIILHHEAILLGRIKSTHLDLRSCIPESMEIITLENPEEVYRFYEELPHLVEIIRREFQDGLCRNSMIEQLDAYRKEACRELFVHQDRICIDAFVFIIKRCDYKAAKVRR